MAMAGDDAPYALLGRGVPKAEGFDLVKARLVDDAPESGVGS
jgi:hypothetical protein